MECENHFDLQRDGGLAAGADSIDPLTINPCELTGKLRFSPANFLLTGKLPPHRQTSASPANFRLTGVIFVGLLIQKLIYNSKFDL